MVSCTDTFTLGGDRCLKKSHEFIHPTVMDVDHARGTNVVFVRMFSEPETIVMLDTAGAQTRTVWEKVITTTHPRRKVSHIKYINRNAILVGFDVADMKMGHKSVVSIVNATTGIDVMPSIDLSHEVSGIASARYRGRAVVWDKCGFATTIDTPRVVACGESSSWCTEYDTNGCMAAATKFGMATMGGDFKMRDEWVSCAVAPEGDLAIFGGKGGRLLLVTGDLHGDRATPHMVWDRQLEAEEWTVHFAAAGSTVICHDGVGTVKALGLRSGAPTWSMNTCPLISFPNGVFGIAGIVVSDHENTIVRFPGSSLNSTADFTIVCLGENGEVERLLFKKDDFVASNIVQMKHTQMRASVSPTGNNLLCTSYSGTVTLLDNNFRTTWVHHTEKPPWAIAFA